jgi:hypothetical protein
MLEAMCADKRLRGMFLHYGAGTGRWSSLIVQLQNLYRPVIKDTDTAIDAMVDFVLANATVTGPEDVDLRDAIMDLSEEEFASIFNRDSAVDPTNGA